MPDQPENENQDQGGRPPILDETKRRKILALLANGSSRRVAARVAGCSHTTIARTAQRDPDFAAELDAAEHNAEIEALRQIRKAAKTDRYCVLPPGSSNAQTPATSPASPPPRSPRKTPATWQFAWSSPSSTI